MLALIKASFAQMSFGCPKCSSAIGASLWFDSEDDAACHRGSELHTVVCSHRDPPLLKQFTLYLKKEKPKNKTGSEFSSAVQWQFIVFRQRARIEEDYRAQDAKDTKVHFP